MSSKSPEEYMNLLPYPVLSLPIRPLPIIPDESGSCPILRLDGAMRSELHQLAHLVVMSPHLLEGPIGKVTAERHCHDYYEMLYVWRGALRNTADPHQEYCIHAGEVMIFPPNVPHNLILAREGTAMFNFMLEAAHLDSLLFSSPLPGLSAHFQQQAPRCLLFSGQTDGLWAIAAQILCEFLAPDPFSDQLINALIPPLLLACERAIGKQSHEDGTIEAAVRYVLNNSATATLEGTARRFGYSPDHLSRLMKQLTGKTFLRLKQDSAIAQSVYLLETTDLPISEIAQRAGIGNLTRFYRLFRQYHHLSPGEYRARHQSSLQ